MTPKECEARAIEALSVDYTEEGVRIWLSAPNKLLGGERAVDLICRGEGDCVLQIIGAIQAGGL